MILNDPELKEIIDKGIKVEINGNQYTVESQRSGSCDGCAFELSKSCPKDATRICTSNGGNILKLMEPFTK